MSLGAPSGSVRANRRMNGWSQRTTTRKIYRSVAVREMTIFRCCCRQSERTFRHWRCNRQPDVQPERRVHVHGDPSLGRVSHGPGCRLEHGSVLADCGSADYPVPGATVKQTTGAKPPRPRRKVAGPCLKRPREKRCPLAARAIGLADGVRFAQRRRELPHPFREALPLRCTRGETGANDRDAVELPFAGDPGIIPRPFEPAVEDSDPEASFHPWSFGLPADPAVDPVPAVQRRTRMTPNTAPISTIQVKAGGIPDSESESWQ